LAEMETTLTKKGQVTIPHSVRARLGLKPKDKVAFEVDGDAVRIRRARSKVLAGYGTIKPRTKPEDFRRLRDEFESSVAQEVIEETAG
jgi:AbrB family looped-hinge helix DNA binding protein